MAYSTSLASKVADRDEAVEVARKENQTFSQYVSSPALQKALVNAVPSQEKREQFQSAMVTLVTTTPDLQKCDFGTIVGACLALLSFGFLPNNQLGFGYVLPFWNGKRNRFEAQCQVGARGMEQLVFRSSLVRKIRVSEIKEGELVSYNPITGEAKFSPIEDLRKRAEAKTIGYYAFFYLIGNNTDTPTYEEYFTREWMENHAETYSKGYQKHSGYTFWEKNFDIMAKKTALKQITKHCPASSDPVVARALAADQGVISMDGKIDYADNDDSDTAITFQSEEQDELEAPQSPKTSLASNLHSGVAENATKAVSVNPGASRVEKQPVEIKEEQGSLTDEFIKGGSR